MELRICPRGDVCTGCVLCHREYSGAEDDCGEQVCALDLDERGETPYSEHIPGPKCPGTCIFVKKE